MTTVRIVWRGEVETFGDWRSAMVFLRRNWLRVKLDYILF